MSVSSSCLAVITGIGCISPFGVGGHQLIAEVLRANCSAIGPITAFSTAEMSSRLGAEVPAGLLPLTDESRRWSRMSYMTVVACRQAIADAGLAESDAIAAMGLIVGTAFGDLRSTEAFSQGFLRKGPVGLSPLLFPNTVMNAMAGTASIALGIKGPMLTLNQHGVAGETAVARAIALIAAGRAPAVLACGVDEIFPTLYATCARLHMLSPLHGGEEACRPFDQRHNGPVVGEGATALVLESPEHAQARGAPILAEVHQARWGRLPARPYHFPRTRDVNSRLLTQLLADAGIAPTDIPVAYLAGSGDPQQDDTELATMAAAFGANGPVITSVTHLTGDYGGGGIFRVAAATATVALDLLPTLDYLCQPVRTDVRFATQPLPYPTPRALVYGVARGGMQTALLIGRVRS